MTPTIGRIVYYVPMNLDEGEKGPYKQPRRGVRAAIVTNVEEGSRVSLTVFTPDGQPYARTGVEYSQEPLTGTWHWPPRVG